MYDEVNNILWERSLSLAVCTDDMYTINAVHSTNPPLYFKYIQLPKPTTDSIVHEIGIMF